MLENGVPIRSVSRSLSVLRRINHHGCISVTDIARLEVLPYPTAFRIVQTLLHEGLIEREEPGMGYRPTALVKTLSHGYCETERRAIAQPHLRALARECGWPALLSTQAGPRMVIEASTHAETTMTIHNWAPGSSLPLATSATGHAWLAHLPKNEARAALCWGVGDDAEDDIERAAAADQAVDCIVEQEPMLAMFAEIREQGYAWRLSTYDDHIKTASIAAPVYKDGALASVLTISYFAAAMKPAVAIERLVALLRRTAATITHEFSRPTI